MGKLKKIAGILPFLFLILLNSLFSDEREENIDLFVVLDKSLSMEEEIDPVKSYVIDSLIEETMIPGDRFVLIQFYGEAEILVAEDVVSEDTKVDFKNTVSSIAADGRFTDIGNALDKLKSAIDTYTDEGRREYLLLITDGKQEAPEDSKYYSPDGTFNHAFLENAKTIQKEGWKIQVLGIGTASAAKELAEQLSGGYTETGDEPSLEEIEEKTRDFFGTIEIAGEPKITPVGKKGETKLSLPLTAEGFSNEQTINFNTVKLALEQSGTDDILIAEDSSYDVPPEGDATITIPFTIDRELPPGTYKGTLTFTFNGLTVITPARKDVVFKVKGFFGSNIWVIPVIAIVALAIIGLAFFLVMKTKKTKPCVFRLYIDNRPAQSAPISLEEGGSIYIKRDGASYTIVTEKDDKTVGKIKFSEGKLKLTSLASEWFTLPDEVPESVLDQKIVVKAKSGLKKELFFKAV